MRQKNFSSKKNTLIISILGIIVYRFLLDFVYIDIITPVFGYTGFSSSFNLLKYLLSWFLLFLFIPFFLSIHSKEKLSSIILILLFLFSFLPFTTMVAYYSNYNYIFILSNVLYWIAIFCFYKLLPNFKIPILQNDKLSSLVLNSIIIIFFIVVFYISWRYTGFRISFNLLNVYDLRDEATKFQLPTILTYVYSASKAINPILIVFFLSRKKYFPVIGITFIQLLSFSINGSKTVFFTTVLALLLYWLYKTKYKYILSWILSLIVILGIIEFYFIETFFIITFFIRRVFFVPNQLSFYYFDFFSTNEPDYFRQSFLRHLGFDSPYPPIDNMIGGLYFNKPDMGANNGLLSDALLSFGPIGIIIMPLLVIISLKILDACTVGLDIKIFIISGITLTFIFISSLFFTILLTHGFIALCIVLYLLPRNKNGNKSIVR